MLTFRVKVPGLDPYDGIYPSSGAAMDEAFRRYPEARSITVRPLQ